MTYATARLDEIGSMADGPYHHRPVRHHSASRTSVRPLVYNLACSESLSERTAEAIDHLRQATGAAEKFRAHARTDSDFDPIRDEPAFKALIGQVLPP